ncbi:MAG: FAD-dependent oxidoreductase [Piscinibacter sp.]|uniref:FAD-dependent oxidoreductase n=1 Tax=Piscinibacter sp. TaxID=1903157 RepID=UPI003D1480E6
MNDAPLRIAVIGGGVSGLSAVYELTQRAIAQRQPLRVTLFEKCADVGGNAVSGWCSLGRLPQGEAQLLRFVDLGVNDLNLDAYPLVAEAMARVGYDELSELENSECYYMPDGRVRFTLDGELQAGTRHEDFDFARLEGGDLPRLQALIVATANRIIGDQDDPDLDMTVGRFFTDCIERPFQMLHDPDESWPTPAQWADPAFVCRLSRLVTRLRDEFFLPRMSAMYFADERGPLEIPLAVPFCYYRTQEGQSGGHARKPRRRYFGSGSQAWLERLADWLVELNDEASGISVSIQTGREARVTVAPDGFEVVSRAGAGDLQTGCFDRCIVATHADEAADLLHFGEAPALRAQENLLRGKVLERVRYSRSVAVAHTWSGVLPPAPALWRAYNILIREGCGLQPYSITYVCNRHQNDAHDTRYDRAGVPPFFVTLNPQRPVPPEFILRWSALPELDEAQRRGLSRGALARGREGSLGAERDADQAVAWFRHNVLDRAGFEAQKTLRTYHGQLAGSAQAPLYFTGGWSRGAGLHEECWRQARDLAAWMLPERCAC